MKHTPIITANRATCSCKRWPAVERGPAETQGQFTWRAATAHERHAHGEADGLQIGMFAEPLPSWDGLELWS